MILQSNEIVSNCSDLPMLRAYHATREPFRRENTEHRHTAFEVSIIAQGHGVYRVGERQYAFSPEDVFLFSTDEAHCITEAVDDLRVINLQFEPRFIWMPGATRSTCVILTSFFIATRCFAISCATTIRARSRCARCCGRSTASFCKSPTFTT